MILALELSSRRGSVCVHDGLRAIASVAWDDPDARHPGLYDALARVLREAGAGWTDLAAVAVGRGPGSFSGVRAALVAAQALALPSRTPVIAVASGEALAHAAGLDASAPRDLVVAGDARRGSVWYAHFRRHGREVRMEGAWGLAPAAGFAGRVPAGALLLTPDAPRFARATGIDSATERFPEAADVALLAALRLQRGEPSDPPEPLYLHAAV